jgi:hypothetical protein
VIAMPKRKPDQVIVHRIELNTFERDLLETALLANIGTNLFEATVPSVLNLLGNLSDPIKLYSFLTILEMAGLLETPVPTLGDLDNEAEAAIIAIKDWLGFELAYDENAEANTENAQILSNQAIEATQEAEKIARETSQAYRNGQASYEDMMAAQRAYNRQQSESFKANLIAQSWDYYFYLNLSGMEFDQDGNQIPNTGRFPNKQEVSRAKRDGVYYPANTERKSFINRALSNMRFAIL